MLPAGLVNVEGPLHDPDELAAGTGVFVVVGDNVVGASVGLRLCSVEGVCVGL